MAVTTFGALLWFPLLLYSVRESPRFLLSVNQAGASLREFREIGLRNGAPLPENAVISQNGSEKPQKAKTYTLMDLMRHNTIREPFSDPPPSNSSACFRSHTHTNSVSVSPFQNREPISETPSWTVVAAG